MTHDVVVIGAGVSGLATAYDLQQAGHDVIVLERQVVVGGNAISERFDGFLMEHGPSTMNAFVPEASDFSKELGLAGTRIDLGAGVRKRYIRDGDHLHGISTNALGFLIAPYLSLAGRFSMMCEVFRTARRTSGEETIHDFVTRRFGREFADKVMEPLAAGLFAGDSRRLSVSAAFPKLVEFEQRYGSITRAVIAARRGSQPGNRLFSWPDGIASLPRALAAQLGDRVRTGITVTRIGRSAHGFDVTTNSGTVRSRALVLAVQPHVAAMLVEPLDPDAASAAGDMEAPPLSVVFTGFQRSLVVHPLDGLGFLSTKGKAQIVTGAQFNSTMFHGRAPTGHVSISSYVGGARNPDLLGLPADELLALTNEELRDLLGIKGDAVVQRVRHWPRGLPQYTIGHGERVSKIEDANERLEGLFFVGNYLHGVSVANCLATARTTAAKISAQLSDETQSNCDLDVSTSSAGASRRAN